jgi:DNA repair protein RecO (recombination protein O)
MSLYNEVQGYLIHQRNFSNNSLILEIFCQESGMVHILAKGIKTNKRLKSQLQYFSPLKIQYFGKSNLKTLASINLLAIKKFENIIDNTAGLYLNELLHHSLLEFESAELLYHCYRNTIQQLGKGKLTPLLREFEKQLLKHNGFELNINPNINADDWISIDEHMGLFQANTKNDKLCKNEDLIKFLANQKLDNKAQKRINKFMLQAINMSLNNKRIYSRELLKTLTTVKINR